METAIFNFEMLILLLANILNPTNIRVVLWQKKYLINSNDADCCDHGTVCYQWWSGHPNEQSYFPVIFLPDIFQACSFLFLWLLLLPVCASSYEVDIPWISRPPSFCLPDMFQAYLFLFSWLLLLYFIIYFIFLVYFIYMTLTEYYLQQGWSITLYSVHQTLKDTAISIYRQYLLF